MTDNVLGGTDDPRLPSTPERPIWEREPVRVVNGVFTTLMAVNVILMLTDVYEEESRCDHHRSHRWPCCHRQ